MLDTHALNFFPIFSIFSGGRSRFPRLDLNDPSLERKRQLKLSFQAENLRPARPTPLPDRTRFVQFNYLYNFTI